MFLAEVFEDAFEVRSAYFLQFVTYFYCRLFDFDDSAQIYRSADNYCVARSIGDSLFQVFYLLIAVAHSG